MSRSGWRLMLGVLAAAVVIGFLIPSDPTRTEEVRRVSASTFAAGPSGAKALYLLLERTGSEVARFRDTDYANVPDGTLWILSDEPLPGLAAKALAERVRKGGQVIGAPAAVAPLLERLGLEGFETTSVDGHPALATHAGRRLESEQAWTLDADRDPDEVYARVNAVPVVARWSFGEGSVVVLGAPDLARNDRIARADNGAFLWELARGTKRQVFDETRAGLGETGLLPLLSHVPYRLTLGQLALAGAVLALGLLFRRFPADPPVLARRRATLDHLQAVARFWALARDPGLPLGEIAAAVAARARRRGGRGDDPFASWIGAVRPELEPAAREAFEQASALRSGQPLVGQACAAAARLIDLEREALRW